MTETAMQPDGKSHVRRAKLASGLERQGKFSQATHWWLMAADVAPTATEQHWCESRAALCHQYEQMPDSVPGVLQPGKKEKKEKE